MAEGLKRSDSSERVAEIEKVFINSTQTNKRQWKNFSWNTSGIQYIIAIITLRRCGIWNLAQTPRKNFKTHWNFFSNFSASFEIFPLCLKAKFQIQPLRSVMFAVNTSTRAASNLDYLQFCSSQPFFPLELFTKNVSGFSKIWVSFQILSEF